MNKKLERITTFEPAFDKRHDDPNKNYGICSVRCRMVLKGEKGAVQFLFLTGMFLPETVKEYYKTKMDLFHTYSGGDQAYYMGFDVGYHSHKPRYEGQTSSTKNCEVLDGKPCYCDGSSMEAEKYMDILVREGSKKIWEMLEKYYKEIFL